MNAIQKKLSLFLERTSEALAAPFAIQSRGLALLLMLLCLGMNVSIRLLPVYLSGLRQDAILNVLNAEPGKDPGKLSDELAGKINAEFLKLKEPYQDEAGGTYLMEKDPYAWAAWTRDILRSGHPGDSIVNGKSYDSTMLAPKGTEVYSPKLLFYLTAFLYKGVCLFTSTISLDQFLFLVPVFYSTLFLLALYLFVRRWSTDLTAFLAVTFWGCMRESIHRGSAGWYDLDMPSLFMALAVAGCLIEGFRKGTWRRLVFFTVAAAFFEGLYAATWPGWWFMLVVAAGFFMGSAAARVLSGPKNVSAVGREILPYAVSACLFFALSFVFSGGFSGIDIPERLAGLKGFLRFDTAFSKDIWPNVLYTISELGSLSLRRMAVLFYSPWIFLAILFSVVAVPWREWRTGRRPMVLMLLGWFLFMFYATVKSHRFIIYLAVPAFIFFSILVAEYVPRFIAGQWAGLKRISGFLIYIALIAFWVATVFQSGITYAERLKPGMNDAWHQALTRLDRDSPKDAIVNSWWDFGSWFRYYGRRRVIFDGQSQEGQLAYWMASVLLESNETQAVRILRMLNNSNRELFRRMAGRIQDPFRRKALLDRLLVSDREQAAEILAANGFSEQDARPVLGDLFDTPSPAYFVVEASLLEKMSNISFLGNWDFQKLMVEENKKEPREKVLFRLSDVFGLTPEESAGLYGDQTGLSETLDRNEVTSTRFNFFSDAVRGKKEGDRVRFGNGVVFNTVTGEALYRSGRDPELHIPERTVIWRDGIRHEIQNEKGEKGKGVLMIVRGEEYRAIVASDGLLDSLFVRLYFLRGEGLRHFKPFYADDEHGISIYEIVWDPV